MKKVLSVRKPFEKFVLSDFYLLLVFGVSLASWYVDKPLIALVFYIVSALSIGIFCDTPHGIIPLFAFITFIFSDPDKIKETPTILCMVGAVLGLLIGLGIFMLRKKQKFRFRAPMLGFSLLLLACILGGVTDGYTFSKGWWTGFGFCSAMLIVGLFLINSIKGVERNYYAKCFALVAILIAAEVFIYFLRCEDIIESILHKQIVLGWAISNGIAMTIVFMAPFLLYLANRSNFPLPFLLGYVLCVVAVFMTMSRGCILVISAAFFPSIIYSAVTSRRKLLYLLSLVVLGVLVWLAYSYLEDSLKPVFDRLKMQGLNDNGRTELWELAISKWLNGSKLFGTGFVEGVPTRQFLWYHNTWLQMLSNMGLLGVAAYIVHCRDKYYYLMRTENKFSIFAMIGYISAGLYGMIDVVYFTAYYLIPMLLLTVIGYRLYERNKGEKAYPAAYTTCRKKSTAFVAAYKKGYELRILKAPPAHPINRSEPTFKKDTVD